MIEFERFVEGLALIGVALKQPYGPASLTGYHDILGSQTDGEEWPRFVKAMLERQRWPGRSPNVPDIQDALREFRGQRPMLVESIDAYDRVLGAGIYSPEGGTTWNYRHIREACGDAAAEAFLAAGGNAAFATTWNEDKRRERFAVAYAEAVREEPMAALLPPGQEIKALPPVPEPTREEARSVIDKLRDMVGAEEEKPKSTVVIVSDERLAALRRQAEEIQA